MRSICRPIHLADDPAPAKLALGPSQALEHIEHLVLIKSPIPKVHFRTGSHLELSGLFCSHPVDARRSQSLQMIAALAGIDEVNRFVATCEAISYERQQYPVRFFVAVEERTHVTIVVQLGSGKPDSFSLLGHRVACSC